MSKLPKIFGDGRAAGIGLVAALAVGQAVAVGAAAFGTFSRRSTYLGPPFPLAPLH